MRGVAGTILPLTLLVTSLPSAATDSSVDVDDGQSPAQANDEETSAPRPDVGARTPQASGDQLKLLLGGGAINLPRYPGSAIDYTRGLPFVSLGYGRYFFGADPGAGAGAPAGLGAYLLRDKRWSLGVDVGGEGRMPRRASDAPVLRGWGDIPGAVRAGAFVSYRMPWMLITSSVSIANHNQGVVASLGAMTGYRPTPRLTLSIGPRVTWASSQYAMTFFGVTTAQSQIAGIAPHPARAGLNFLGGTAGANYALSTRWSVAATVSYGKLQGDAADSPVTTAKIQRMYGGFLIYRLAP